MPSCVLVLVCVSELVWGSISDDGETEVYFSSPLPLSLSSFTFALRSIPTQLNLSFNSATYRLRRTSDHRP